MKWLRFAPLLFMMLGVGFQGMAQSADETPQFSIEELKKADELTDLISEDELNGEIVSFEVTYRSAETQNLVIEINDGDHFSDKVQQLIANAQPNDRFYFDRIKTINKEMEQFSLKVAE